MTRPVFCAVADDDTGATDLAGMLSEEGLRTVLVVDGDPERWSAGYDAVVLGAGSRALPAGEAYLRTREATRKLRSLAPRVIEIKYCSTFDSTTEGNIGPSLDAAMDELAEQFTVALPALPVNGRTTYMGHHFVRRQLLSASPMRDHPLTPMRNPDLVSHLQSQTAAWGWRSTPSPARNSTPCETKASRSRYWTASVTPISKACVTPSRISP